ncbi:4-(cytidine 5'-diphospho)-2-C-methyl-D-erythritol kinase [Helicobacter sp. 11S02596-1]|uniref:4-(cytidine 5'-diphospho)-2-C-methyl-D-erythritol kinase n=1 Tax=Helicobacter sp. 11S02596-1 TaxID=1476194 RepID=UPI000BA4F333|nr:4-(cytidine 5'-diphospho)-2-C-methyl-D-erythritol kinase [Helicobacter sp. 11S02596-1]PAF44496.1 4-(cytidine 5'-diphospho)-2-C-methyl-D-erythritol kinase [Helicobacter sp. 11S02596-1]
MIFDVFPKLNIFLKILGIKGSYHEIFSRFVLAKGQLKDIVEIKTSENFCLKGDFGCQQEDNLIYRAIIALEAFLKEHNKDFSMLKNLSIEVQKGIPSGAGLGGGSADAGMCLRKINEFFDLGLDTATLCLIGSKVGADVAFFASGFESANVSGFGEIIERFNEPSYDFEIFVPDVFCDTANVYRQYDKMLQEGALSLSPAWQNHQENSDKILFSNTNKSNKDAACGRGSLNDLFYPALRAYPALLHTHNTLGNEWFFSGSGSSFFRLKGDF